jgi:hypothetical protein
VSVLRGATQAATYRQYSNSAACKLRTRGNTVPSDIDKANIYVHNSLAWEGTAAYAANGSCIHSNECIYMSCGSTLFISVLCLLAVNVEELCSSVQPHHKCTYCTNNILQSMRETLPMQVPSQTHNSSKGLKQVCKLSGYCILIYAYALQLSGNCHGNHYHKAPASCFVAIHFSVMQPI